MSNGNLNKRLIQIRKEVEYLKNDKEGQFGDYVSLEKLLANIRKQLDQKDILLYTQILQYKMETERKKTNNGEKTVYIISGGCNIIFEYEDEQKEIPWILAGEGNNPAQALGMAKTYTERYFLIDFFKIPTSKLTEDSFKKKYNYNNSGINCFYGDFPKEVKKYSKHIDNYQDVLDQYQVDSAKNIKDPVMRWFFINELKKNYYMQK